MSKMSFTPAQQDAIEADGGSVIVSAAAGSGKTRVLVQRVIRLLTDPEHPIDADRLLIVTFTKAAAEEMRSRIASAIEEKLFYEPDNTVLRRQQALLASADICTIHSFCSKVIRENFYLLDIDQDFRIASEGESTVIKRKVLSDLMEEQYQAKESGFLFLSELLSSSKSDQTLEKTILSLYEKSCSHPFPSLWLKMAESFYDPAIPIQQTIYASAALEQLRTTLPYLKEMLHQASAIILSQPAFCTGTKTCGENKLLYLRHFLEQLEEAVSQERWDSISECISGFEKVAYRKPTGKKVSVSEEDCAAVKNCFDNIEAQIEKNLLPIFGIDSETYRRDTEQLYPAVQSLCTLLKLFEERYFAAKKERGLLDFSDLEHLMLQLLVDYDGTGFHATEFARHLSRQYDQIMVDEYQDTNETQEYIFRYVSQEENNLFVVGDIKQSIYRFREARPEIFKKRRQKASAYDKEHPLFPAKIILDKNFRSREGIIDSINFVFHAIMSERVGEITYNEEEALTAGASYPAIPEGTEAAAEIHLLDSFALQSGQNADDDTNAYILEAKYIAQWIHEKVENKMLVTDEGRLRPVEYGDFAVLLRFLTTHGQEYAETLNRCGIPAYIDKPYSLFGCYEVNILIALLKMIDNPLQDIPVLAVLLSPVCAFTADDLADIKTQGQGKYLFHKICHLLANPEGLPSALVNKADYFMRLFQEMRKLSVTMAVSKVLNAFFDKTGYLPLMTAAENGDIRLKNIRKFMSFVQDYENSGRNGLTEFVRYLHYLEENGTEISVSDTVPAQSVKIMSVHHSKGLEFPVCILAGLNAKGSNDTDEVLYHADLGFGMKTMDREKLLKFNTLQRNVISRCKSTESISEAMRVLYVAMTRAKEKLMAVIHYAVSSEDGLTKKLKQLASQIMVQDGRLSVHTVGSTSSLADWLMFCALVHPSMQSLREQAESEHLPILPCRTPWDYRLVRHWTDTAETEQEEVQEIPIDPHLYDFLQKRFAETYRYQERTLIPSKISASSLAHSTQLNYHIAESRPAFTQKDHMTGAEKGTAMHTFLQYVDFQALTVSMEQEKRRLVQQGFLTQEQADVIQDSDIEQFLHSQVFADICSAEKVLREYRFTVNLPVRAIEPAYSSEDSVILQGAMDCVMLTKDGIIIVDYKTDRVKDAEALAEKYRIQLMLYKQAAEQLFTQPVIKCCIYSIHKAQTVEILS